MGPFAAVLSGLPLTLFLTIAAFIIGIMNNGMSMMGIGVDWQQVIKGIVLLAAVCLDVHNKNNRL